MPHFLGLLPFRTIDLVLLADLVLAYILFESGYSMLEPNLASTVTLPGEISFTAAASSLPLALRDRWPLGAWRLAAVMVPTSALICDPVLDMPYTAQTAIMYLLVVYAVAVRCERHVTIGVWIVSAAGLWFLEILGRESGTAAFGVVGVTAAALLGYNVRARRTAVRRLAEEERRSEQALAGQAVLEERTRIARELHDIVAHHMSVIAIQAEAVPLKARGEARLLEEGLAEIRTLSLTAMTEMRRVLGVLRDADGARDTAPQPGLGHLEDLVATARSAGLTVTLKPGGDLTGLPAAVSLSAYRIVQESLSNAMRHAPGSAVSVQINRTAAELHLHVADDGGRRSPAGPGRGEASRHAGHGLLGMRERVSMLGGKLWAGPAGDGFAVTAILPVPDAP
jgi:signal transduction histidine kinase